MLIMYGEQGVVEGLIGAISFPCWYWGPALALAVWGYVAHRVQSDRVKGLDADEARDRVTAA
jgi:hypothetical protein